MDLPPGASSEVLAAPPRNPEGILGTGSLVSPKEKELKLVGVFEGSVIQDDFLILSMLLFPIAEPGRFSLIRELLLVLAISGVRGV